MTKGGTGANEKVKEKIEGDNDTEKKDGKKKREEIKIKMKRLKDSEIGK